MEGVFYPRKSASSAVPSRRWYSLIHRGAENPVGKFFVKHGIVLTADFADGADKMGLFHLRFMALESASSALAMMLQTPLTDEVHGFLFSVVGLDGIGAPARRKPSACFISYTSVSPRPLSTEISVAVTLIGSI